MNHREARYPAPDPDVFRVSNSTVNQVLRCSLHYHLDQEAKHRSATVAMMRGTAVAEAARSDNEAKMRGESGRRLPDLVDIAVAAYERELEVCEYPEGSVAAKGEADSVASAASAYGIHISPKIEHPIAAEERLGAVIDEGIELVGTPDCIEAGGTIRDTKCGQPWSQERVDRTRQLVAYDLLHEAHYGAPAERLCIDSVHRTGSRGWDGETLWTRRTERDRTAYVEIVRQVRKVIVSGIALPAPEGAWWCSEKWCRHWHRCPHMKGR